MLHDVVLGVPENALVRHPFSTGPQDSLPREQQRSCLQNWLCLSLVGGGHHPPVLTAHWGGCGCGGNTTGGTLEVPGGGSNLRQFCASIPESR